MVPAATLKLKPELFSENERQANFVSAESAYPSMSRGDNTVAPATSLVTVTSTVPLVYSSLCFSVTAAYLNYRR